MSKNLVIVESPAKARTIKKFLGKDFTVEASIGHIRDLPGNAAEIPAKFKSEEWSRLGVNIGRDFEPLYVIPDSKKKQVQKLKDALKKAERLYLATDEDREGEAISWHLIEALQPDKKTGVSRLVFHEITKTAIQEALDHPRDIDQNLVQAQETRRVLDRLYGYQVSPILWRKVAPRLSAGRVQSVAVKLIVDREKERTAFVAATYWDITGTFDTTAKKKELFTATLREYNGKKLASGKDFDPSTGKLGDPKLLQLKEAEVKKLVSELTKAKFSVISAESKPVKQSPAPPFTTATLQQQASSRLGMSAQETMRIAQTLYENGYITYMRTDSTVLAKEAVDGIRQRIKDDFGAKYLLSQPRAYKSKVKNAQEAHEAIRPAGFEFHSPEELRKQLDPRQLKLYELIWRRTLACQMPDAQIQQTTVDIEGGKAIFRATGKVIEFDGFLKLYPRPVTKKTGDDENGDGEDVTLPALKKGDAVTAEQLDPVSHTTKPPARYTEASLIKELEARGIGRPSTYAAIIETILRREYVFKRGSALAPTFTAYAVVRLMEEHFARLVDPEFTAEMEDDLDAISRGEKERTPYLKKFYHGSNSWQGLEKLIEQDIDARDICTIDIGKDDVGNLISVRIGKWGPYLECGEWRARVPDGLAPDELTIEKAREILEAGAGAHDALTTDSETGLPIYLMAGRFGPYLQLGERSNEKGAEKPKQKGLLPGMKPEDVTPEIAEKIMSLPREIGKNPDNSQMIVADLGRYGPYLTCGDDTRSLSDGDDLFEITLQRATQLFREEKKSSFQRRAKSGATLREIGKHPDRDGVTLVIKTGYYGPYITDGTINASLPKTSDPEKMTLNEAVELYERKLAKGPTPKRGRRKSAAKKTAAKKSSAKKTTGKPSPMTKKTVKKKSASRKKAAKSRKSGR